MGFDLSTWRMTFRPLARTYFSCGILKSLLGPPNPVSTEQMASVSRLNKRRFMIPPRNDAVGVRDCCFSDTTPRICAGNPSRGRSPAGHDDYRIGAFVAKSYSVRRRSL